VHMLGDAARRCRLSLGLALLDAKSPGAHSLSQALVLGSRRVGVLHRAKAHRPCALRVPALGERAPAPDQVVDCATSETRSEEGFLDVGHEVREEVVRACRFDDEDLFLLILLPPLGRGPGVYPGGCGCGGLRGSWLGPGATAGVRFTGGAGVTGAGATGAAWGPGTGAGGAGVTV
jgi:hypothetical protein